MANRGRRYTPEFRTQMVELARSGRTTRSLAKEFGTSGWSISRWIRQAERDVGKADGRLTTNEREELVRLRNENRKLKEEREILSKAAAWFATESGASKRSSNS